MASGRRGLGGGRGKRDDEAIDGTGPIDVAAVYRDEALIEAIAGDGPVSTDSPEEYQLAALLANWRAEVIAEPIPDTPDLDTVVAIVNQQIGARQAYQVAAARRGRLRLLRPLGATAAAVAVIAGSMTALSYGAEPGDPLWKFKEVAFSQQAKSTVAQIDATSELNKAKNELEQRNAPQARQNLDRARQKASQVSDPKQRNDLLERLNGLAAEAEKQFPGSMASTVPVPPATTVPGKPTNGTDKPGSVTLPTAPSNLPIPSLPLPTGSHKPPTNDLRPPTNLPTLPSIPALPSGGISPDQSIPSVPAVPSVPTRPAPQVPQVPTGTVHIPPPAQQTLPSVPNYVPQPNIPGGTLPLPGIPHR